MKFCNKMKILIVVHALLSHNPIKKLSNKSKEKEIHLGQPHQASYFYTSDMHKEEEGMS